MASSGVQQQSFVVFGEHWPGLAVLSDAQRGRLFQALFAFHGFCGEPELDQATQAVLAMMLPRMKANWDVYQEKVRKRREAGQIGGLAKAANASGGVATSSDGKQTLAKASNASGCLANGSKTYHDNDTEPPSGVGVPTEHLSLSSKSETPGVPSTANGRGESAPESPPLEAPPKPKVDLRLLDFERWYAAYPRHQKRAEAQKTWERLARARLLPPLQVMLDSLGWQRLQPQWRDPQFVPLPGTYLNAQQWLDEKLAQAPPSRDRPRQRWGPSPEEEQFSLSAGIREAVDKLKAEAEEAGEEA